MYYLKGFFIIDLQTIKGKKNKFKFDLSFEFDNLITFP